ncbi:hypothetical protein SODALDRAFT_100898 [Sodiomyces alkalinus F11]|uniref:Uncharacterized protein n=1 Tax=Sodiomyces alkalinus (strain CBS 110278 / VKM F-3762 / F11) TaxID=1314773 RepID=A0A3N2Q1J0_SODAK|nr:hypothetical protein SODALDRAFT_100898 [Sodiomyces alkalinus F11]ROT40624.1 hypothetical protein SODALDRAFT_100898 [Sodiomyces alkalinus F11]
MSSGVPPSSVPGIDNARQYGPPPYTPQGALPGLVPSTTTDIPVSAVLIVLYVSLAVIAVRIIRSNKRRGTPFTPAALFVIIAVLRTLDLSLRIAYAVHQDDVNLAIAATVLSNAGVIVLIILNLLLGPRLMRSFFGPRRSATGWRRRISTLPFLMPIPLLPITLIAVINVIILTFFTMDPKVRSDCLTVQRVAVVVFTVLAFIPTPPSLAVALLSSSSTHSGSGLQPTAAKTGGLLTRVRHPGSYSGSVRTSALVLLTSSLLLTVGAAIRAVMIFSPGRSLSDPAWYHGRPAFYCFNFVIEILVMLLYLLVRFDRRFQIPVETDEKNRLEESMSDREETPGGETDVQGKSTAAGQDV